MSNLKTNNRGFSLLELLIYIAILSGFLVVIVNLFFTVSSNSAKEEVRAEVRQNLRFAAQQIASEIRLARLASDVVLPAGDPGNVLDIAYGGETTEFKIIAGVLQKTRGTSVENVTGNNVTVSDAPPVFRRIGDTIQIKLKIDYNDNGKGDYKFSESAQTAISLRL